MNKNCSVQLSLNVRHSLSTFRFLPDMVKIQNETKLQLSSSDDGRQKLKKNIYASYSTLGGATYFNDVRSSTKIIQVQESGAQSAQSSDGTNIQKKEILIFTFI